MGERLPSRHVQQHVNLNGIEKWTLRTYFCTGGEPYSLPSEKTRENTCENDADIYRECVSLTVFFISAADAGAVSMVAQPANERDGLNDVDANCHKFHSATTTTRMKTRSNGNLQRGSGADRVGPAHVRGVALNLASRRGHTWRVPSPRRSPPFIPQEGEELEIWNQKNIASFSKATVQLKISVAGGDYDVSRSAALDLSSRCALKGTRGEARVHLETSFDTFSTRPRSCRHLSLPIIQIVQLAWPTTTPGVAPFSCWRCGPDWRGVMGSGATLAKGDAWVLLVEPSTRMRASRERPSRRWPTARLCARHLAAVVG